MTTDTAAQAPALDDETTPDAMRDRVLVALADYVLTRHADHLAVINGSEGGALDVSPAAALVAIVDEASASFDLEAATTLDEARDVARETWEHAAAQVPAAVARHVAQARKAAGLQYG